MIKISTLFGCALLSQPYFMMTEADSWQSAPRDLSEMVTSSMWPSLTPRVKKIDLGKYVMIYKGIIPKGIGACVIN